mmetsp:Transcript_110509/g.297687  ORF Transcript_110509/g.297687 Transcript_110509/m.297687 type:complete len:264 (-) Transcript_110509:161-952(-)
MHQRSEQESTKCRGNGATWRIGPSCVRSPEWMGPFSLGCTMAMSEKLLPSSARQTCTSCLPQSSPLARATTKQHSPPPFARRTSCSSSRPVKMNREPLLVSRCGGVLYIANAGDSRCVLGSDDGTPPVQLTVDHRPDDANEYARIEAAGGELFDPEDGNGSRVCGPNSCMLACSRSIGDRHFKPVVTSEPDTCSRPISAGDAFAILASDGVWDELSNLKACNLVSSSLESGCSPSEAAATLCEAAHKAGSEDNISAIVVLLKR